MKPTRETAIAAGDYKEPEEQDGLVYEGELCEALDTIKDLEAKADSRESLAAANLLSNSLGEDDVWRIQSVLPSSSRNGRCVATRQKRAKSTCNTGAVSVILFQERCRMLSKSLCQAM
mmetsp:Transcript_2344/g.3384  ORF Transcript_2344/g.3384 Transcript_2344/m.3384 type:complete len:118 (-) Transcript_2344:1025-1378(-)